jgi:hypothetical protein
MAVAPDRSAVAGCKRALVRTPSGSMMAPLWPRLHVGVSGSPVLVGEGTEHLIAVAIAALLAAAELTIAQRD